MAALKTPAVETGLHTPSIPALRRELGGQLRKILVRLFQHLVLESVDLCALTHAFWTSAGSQQR